MLSEIKSDLKQINSGTLKHNEIINIGEAADFLYISKGTLYSFVSSRKIPHSKVGKRIYFNKAALVDWVAKYKRKTIDEIKDEADAYLSRRQ